MAGATAEKVSGPAALAKIETRPPRSARKTPQVRPETPAPMIATALAMSDLCNGRMLSATEIKYSLVTDEECVHEMGRPYKVER